MGRACALANATVSHGLASISKSPSRGPLWRWCKLCESPHHFQEYTVVIITQPPLRYMLRSVHYVGRIAKWSAVLGASDVRHMPRALIKGLILEGLMVLFAEFPSEKEAKGQTRIF